MIRDIHYHILGDMTFEQTKEYYDGIIKQNDVASVNFLSCPCFGAINRLQNLACLTMKDAYSPNGYAFMGLYHYGKGIDTAEGFLRQLEDALKQGFDGVKSLEGKPDCYKNIGYGIDDPIYDLFYEKIEKEQIPFLMHVNDPATFWDKDKMREWGIDECCYLGTPDYPTYEGLYGEVDNILKKFPKLRVIFAHFYFMSEDIDRAKKFLDAHPNVCFDITPGYEMYVNFSKNPQMWREFFIEYQDRLYLGTDNCNETDSKIWNSFTYPMTVDFLKKTEPYKVGPYNFVPLGLPEDTVDTICRKNFEKLLPKPKPINRAEVKKETEKIKLENAPLTEMDKYWLSVVEKRF